jgi:hypothetical protein
LQLKKTINFGDVAANFETVSSKLKELEGTFTDGFDNNIKFLIHPKNWVTKNLVNGKPPISVRTRMDSYGFELHCFPIIKGEPQAVVMAADPNSPFREYNPASFGPVIKINGLDALMTMAIIKGDEADFELIKYAHMMTEQLIQLFRNKMQVNEYSGQSIKQLFEEKLQAHKDNKHN